MRENSMNRRSILKGLGAMFGAMAIAPLVKPKPGREPEPKSEKDEELVDYEPRRPSFYTRCYTTTNCFTPISFSIVRPK